MMTTLETWEDGIMEAAEIALPSDRIAPPNKEHDYLKHLDVRLEFDRVEIRAGRTVNPTVPEYASLARLAWAGATAAGYDLNLGELLGHVADKQADYGQGNILAFGHTGLVVRISDKIARLQNLEKRGRDGAAEPTRDAWTDIIGYSLVGIMLLQDTFKLPLQRDLEEPEDSDPIDAEPV